MHPCLVILWDETFFGATYLINLLSIRVVDNISPLQRLFTNKPNYTLLKLTYAQVEIIFLFHQMLLFGL